MGLRYIKNDLLHPQVDCMLQQEGIPVPAAGFQTHIRLSQLFSHEKVMPGFIFDPVMAVDIAGNKAVFPGVRLQPLSRLGILKVKADVDLFSDFGGGEIQRQRLNDAARCRVLAPPVYLSTGCKR